MSAGADPLSTIKDLDQAYVQIAEKVTPSVVRVSSIKAAPVSGNEGLRDFLKQFPFLPFDEANAERVQATAAAATRDVDGIGIHRVT